MPVCNKCRHEFDVGRFCTNCGHPVGVPADDLAVWRTDTAERPAVVDVERRQPRSHRAARPWLPWATGGLVLVVVASLGAWLLLDDSDPGLVADDPRSTPADSRPADSSPAGDPVGADRDDADRPRKKQAEPGRKEGPAPRPENVAYLATATVPATAPPGTDFDGNVVRYEPRNMLDGVPATCWRMPGDGSGESITFELADETRLRSVGLVNGYAKTAITSSGANLDWYAGNRRVLSVEWAFDDGSVVSQELGETRRLQIRSIDPVTTSTVELRLVSVTPPGTGPSRRDYTAISDVALVGSPA